MKPHRTDLVSFIPGVVFVGVALAALFGGLRLDALATEWFWPVSLVIIGIVVLVTSSRPDRPNDEDAPDPAEDAPDPAEDDADAVDPG